MADLVSFYKENANILREVRDASNNNLICSSLSNILGQRPCQSVARHFNLVVMTIW